MFAWVKDLLVDLHHTGRSLAKSPGFTITAVLTLALGISASITIFSVVEKIILEPLPYPESDRIVQIYSSGERFGNHFPLSTPDYCDLRDQTRSFDFISCYSIVPFTLGGIQAESFYGVQCSVNMAGVFGFQPVLGRWFTEEEAKEGANKVVVLSDSLWKRRFNADMNVVGKTIRMDGADYTILGVLTPASRMFIFPRQNSPLEIYQPLPLHPEKDSRGSNWLFVTGRIKQNTTFVQAKTDIQLCGQRINKEYRTGFEPYCVPYAKVVFGSLYPSLIMMQMAVLVVFLLACASVGGMLLARTTKRQIQYAIHMALGASTSQLIRSLLVECFCVSAMASLCGILLSHVFLLGINTILPRIYTHKGMYEINGYVLAFALCLTALTTLLASFPALVTHFRENVAEILKNDTQQQSGSKRLRKRYRLLVITQIAIIIPLVNVAILLAFSYRNVIQRSQEHITENIHTARIDHKNPKYHQAAERTRLQERISEILLRQPGVQSVGFTSKLPFEGGQNTTIKMPNSKTIPDSGEDVAYNMVEISLISPGYFAAAGISLLQGRIFNETDTHSTPTNVVINQTLAKRYFGEANPIGGIINENNKMQVIGVVEDIRQWGIDTPAQPELYYYATDDTPFVYVVIRAMGTTALPLTLIQQDIQNVDPDLAMVNLRTIKAIFDEHLSMRRLMSCLIYCFVGIALLITAIGIYGTLSFQVASRTREIGIHMALGASTNDIIHIVTRQILHWLIIGTFIGLLITLGIGRMVRSQLYEISPWNFLYLGLTILVLFFVTLLACWIPTRRATKMNPTDVLRAG